MTIKVIGWTHNDNDKYPAMELDSVEVRDAIVSDIRANGYEFNGQDHQYHDSCTPVLNNGKRVCCSQRQWGGLMAYAHNVDDWDGNAYLFYFLTEIENPKYPDSYVDDAAINKNLSAPPRVTARRTVDKDYDDFEFRRFTLHNLSARKFKMSVKDYSTLPKSFDNNAALIAELLMEISEKSQSSEFSVCCNHVVSKIISYWLTEDGLSTRDERLSHLETKFEGGRVKTSVLEHCPSDLKESFALLNGNLIPCINFLLNNCPNDRGIKERVRLHLHNIFEYSVLYQIDTVNSYVPHEILEQALELLKSGET